jgi:hypothetical protein
MKEKQRDEEEVGTWQSGRLSCWCSGSSIRIHGEVIEELEKLRETDTVRVIDSLAVYKDAAGEIEVMHLSNLSKQEAVELGSKVAALLGLGIEGEEGIETQVTEEVAACTKKR